MLRTARVLAAAGGFDALVANGRAAAVSGSLRVAGPVIRVGADGLEALGAGERAVAAAFVHTAAGTQPEPPPLDLPAWRELDARLLEAAAGGCMTTALGRSWSWGRKDAFERRLRAHGRRTGRRLPRPATWVAGELPPPGRLVVKQARRHQSLGVELVNTSRTAPVAAGSVVQRLLSDPLLLDGHKFDLRLHVVVVPASRERSRALDATLVRIAARPFQPGLVEAELTPNVVRLRLGLPPGIFDLRRAPMPPALAGPISRRALALGERFLDAYFDWLEHDPRADPPAERTQRAFLLGLDALVAGTAADPRLLLLEANPHPFFWRHFEPCDSAVERALAGLGGALSHTSGRT